MIGLRPPSFSHAASLRPTAPTRRRARAVSRASAQGSAPCLFRRGVFYSAGQPTEAGACVHAPDGGRSLTTKIESAQGGYAYARRWGRRSRSGMSPPIRWQLIAVTDRPLSIVTDRAL